MKKTSFCFPALRFAKRASKNTKYYFKHCQRRFHSSPFSVTAPDCNVAEFIMKDFGKFSNRTALVDGLTEKKISYAELEGEVREYVNALRVAGLQKGDVVCLCGSNNTSFAHIFLAVTASGATLTIANTQLTAGELADQLKLSKSKFLFATADTCSKCLQAFKISNVQRVFEIGCRNSSDTLLASCSTETPCSQLNITKVCKDDVALLPFSSGTTGLPKGVQLTHRNLVSQLIQIRHSTVLPMDSEEDRVITMLPMVHIAGLVIGLLNPLAQGATTIILPKFVPEKFLTAVQRYRGTFSLLAPPVVSFLANDPLVDKYDLSSLHDPYSGASTLGRELTEKVIERLGLSGLRQGYGMSETSPVVTTDTKGQTKYGSIGRPIPGTDCKLVDPETECTVDSSNKNGEIWVRGPQVMKGYLGCCNSTIQAITKDGWFKTGDIGYYDDDGHYFVVDRIKDIIKYKGYQVAPAYLESILMSHPCVTDAAVVGVPAGVLGEVPKAHVILSSHVNEQELLQYVNNQVAPYRQLRGGITFVSEIPKSPSGKILRRLLKQ